MNIADNDVKNQAGNGVLVHRNWDAQVGPMNLARSNILASYL